MKKLSIFLLIVASSFGAMAQEKYGNTMNLGLGIGGYSGYYGYLSRSIPVLHFNYEFDVAKNFTLAPFASFYTFSDRYYWGNPARGYRYYSYRETVLPIGAKGSYYFDDLLEAGSDWDFYLAGSLGFAIASSRWESGYDGDRNYFRGAGSLFIDLHIGAEYHFNKKIGAFLDLSTGVSTIGISLHLTD